MSARVRLLVAVASLGVVSYVFVGGFLRPALGDSTYSQLSVFNEVMHKVVDFYVDPVNVDRTMGAAEQGLTEGLDGDSAYLDADAAKAYQQAPKDGDADVGIELTRRYPFLIVVATRPGSAAEKAQIHTGDVIKTLDGKHTRSISAPMGARLLKGSPGSVVKLTILRATSAEPVDVSLVRERPNPLALQSKVLDGGTAYLKITEFTPASGEAVRAELERFKRADAKSLVLDLRGASFGAVPDAVPVAELLVKGGVVTRLKGKDFPEQVSQADASKAAWDLPVAALVNLGTSGPGEVVAAALLDSGKALVGEHTFGRAALQKNLPLPDGAVLVLTVAKYSSPKGAPIHGRGLEPSVPVASEQEAAGEEAKGHDAVLEKALEVLKGAKAA
jgi:carboxyl-terminal processing protease